MKYFCLIIIFLSVFTVTIAQKRKVIVFEDGGGFVYADSLFKAINIPHNSDVYYFSDLDRDYFLYIHYVDDKPIIKYIESSLETVNGIKSSVKGIFRYYTIENPVIKNNKIIAKGVEFSFYLFDVEMYLRLGDSGSWFYEYYNDLESQNITDTVIKLDKSLFGLGNFTQKGVIYKLNFLFKGKYSEVSYRKLESDDIASKSKKELRIMRNELFARHGHEFKQGGEMDKYFRMQNWYYPYRKGEDVSKYFSFLEKMNLKLIIEYEKGIKK